MNDKPLKLQARDIHKSFGANEVLKGVSLQARAGDVIGIIGSSGSGKSTFLLCINLLKNPTRDVSWWRVKNSNWWREKTAACMRPMPNSYNACAPNWPWCSSTSTCGRI